MKFKFKIIFYINLFLLLSDFYLFCDIGRTGWVIFRKIKSPKPITTITAMRGNLSGVVYNPAILSTIENKELFTIVDLGFVNDIVGGMMYGTKLKDVGLAAGIFYYGLGKETLFWIENGYEFTREVSSIQKDLLFLISYSKKIFSNLSIGTTLKFASSKFVEVVEAEAYVCDLGLIYFYNKNLTISFVVQNLGIAEKFVERKENLPVNLYLAVGYTGVIINSYYYVLGIDIPYFIEEKRLAPTVDIEFGKSPLGIFLGYKANIEEGNLHVGLSLNFKNFDLEYFLIPVRWLNYSHRISLGVKF